MLVAENAVSQRILRVRSVLRARGTVTQMLDVPETSCVEEITANNITNMPHLKMTAALNQQISAHLEEKLVDCPAEDNCLGLESPQP